LRRRVLRVDGTFLRSAVGRRIFALFLLASALPMALVITFTYRGVAGFLAREASAQLVRESKNAAMHALERLQAARSELRGVDVDHGVAGPATSLFRAIAVFESGVDLPRASTGNAVSDQVLRAANAQARRQPGVGDTAVVAVADAAVVEPLIALVETRTAAAG